MERAWLCLSLKFKIESRRGDREDGLFKRF